MSRDPSTRATMSCVSAGCWVEDSTITPPRLVEPRDGALRLQIEMLLTANRELARKLEARSVDRREMSPRASRMGPA